MIEARVVETAYGRAERMRSNANGQGRGAGGRQGAGAGAAAGTRGGRESGKKIVVKNRAVRQLC